MTRLMVVLLALALSCSNRQARDEPTAVAEKQDVAPASSEASEAAVAQQPPLALPRMPGLPSGAQGLLLPPATQGKSRVVLDGCLAQTTASDTLGERFPVSPPTRGPAVSPVTVGALGGGLLVVHTLDHACCLRADVRSAVEGTVVVISEVLSGEPCRCRCRSTVRTAVAVAPGEYTLRVMTNEGGHHTVAYEAPVQIR